MVETEGSAVPVSAPAADVSEESNPIILAESHISKKGRGKLAKPRKSHREDILPASEQEREETDFISGFGITKSEIIFNKWLKTSVETPSGAYDQAVSEKDIKGKNGAYLSKDRKEALALYFNMCYFENQSNEDQDIKDKYELMKRRYNANTPYELASMIYQRNKTLHDANESANNFKKISDPEKLDFYISGGSE